MKNAESRMLVSALLALAISLTAVAETSDTSRQALGYLAPVALSDSGLVTNTLLFQPVFDSSDWRGDLLAYALDTKTGAPTRLHWSAAQQLAARDWRERIVVTRRNDTGQAVAFRYFADLSAEQQQVLGDQARLDYLRGDPSQESTRFRSRSYRDRTGKIRRSGLGPIFHANPLYVRTSAARIYAGANDGFLHVFDAEHGNEIFAYAPGMMYARLTALADSAVNTQPPYSVDGGLSAGQVQFRDGSTHMLLLGALAGGGQGIFALDIGAANIESEADALRSLLWEFSDREEANLGDSYAVPQLAQLNDGRWAVLLGNGYNAANADGHAGTGSAQLLIIDAETGRLIRRIDTYAGDATDPNGLSTTRAIDVNTDGFVDYVYAGDLSGRVWRFDLRGDSTAWHVSCSGAALFNARDELGHARSITAATAIVAHPQQGVRLLFGTGRLLSNADIAADTDAQIQSLYGVWDRLEETCPASTRVLQQTLRETQMADGQRVRSSSRNQMSGDFDVWRIDLPDGERLLTDPQLNNGRLMVTTTQPLKDKGETWLLELDPQTGGAPPQPIFDMNGDGVVNAQDGVPDDNATDAAARVIINGHFYGEGLASMPVFVNQSASRQITYINRNTLTLMPAKPCTGACDDTITDDNNTVNDGSGETHHDDGTLKDSDDWLIKPASPCGEHDCVTETRPNLGRVFWKELGGD
ncbi:MAG: pilus assembly protein [Gammaproteobacteria bacterium]